LPAKTIFAGTVFSTEKKTVFTGHWQKLANPVTNKTVQENTDKQTQYKSEKVDNIEYSKTKLPWFSCLLQHYNKNKKQYMECLVVSYAKYSCCW